MYIKNIILLLTIIWTKLPWNSSFTKNKYFPERQTYHKIKQLNRTKHYKNKKGSNSLDKNAKPSYPHHFSDWPKHVHQKETDIKPASHSSDSRLSNNRIREISRMRLSFFSRRLFPGTICNQCREINTKQG